MNLLSDIQLAIRRCNDVYIYFYVYRGDPSYRFSGKGVILVEQVKIANKMLQIVDFILKERLKDENN